MISSHIEHSSTSNQNGIITNSYMYPPLWRQSEVRLGQGKYIFMPQKKREMLYKSILPLSYYFSQSPFSNIFLNLSITLKFQPQFPFSSHRNLSSSLDNSSYILAPNCIIRPGMWVSVWGGHSLAIGVTNGGKWDNLSTVSLLLDIFMAQLKKKKAKLERKEKMYEQCVLSKSCGLIV